MRPARHPARRAAPVSPPGDPGGGRIYPAVRQLGTPPGGIAYRDPDVHALAQDPAFRACVRAPEGREERKRDHLLQLMEV